MHLETIGNWGSWVWIGFCIVAVGFFFRGVKVGLIPACIDLLGLFTGVFIGFLVGALADLILGSFFPWPTLFTGMVFGFATAVGIFALVGYCSRFIYEFVDEVLGEVLDNPGSLTVRVLFAIGGGIVEVFIGFLLVTISIMFLIACGSAAETQIQKSDLPANWVQETLVKVKYSIEGSSQQGAAMVSEKISQPIAELIRVSQDPQAMKQLKHNPDVQALLHNPTIEAILADAAAKDAVARKDYVTLTENPQVRRVATDFSLVRKLCDSDIQKAIDSALPPSTDAVAPDPAKK